MKFKKKYYEKSPSRWNKQDKADYVLDTYDMGKGIGADQHVVAARFIMMVKRADRQLFQEGLKDGGFIRELAQRVFDSSLDREKAIQVFHNHRLNLRELAKEPPPLD